MMENFEHYEKILMQHGVDAEDARACETIKAFTGMIPDLKAQDYLPCKISDAMKERNVLRPIKIIGYISQMVNPVPMDVSNGDESRIRLTAFQFKIRDSYGSEIEVLPVLYDMISPFLLNGIKQETLLVFRGTVVSYNTPDLQAYLFLLSEICPATSQMELLMLDNDGWGQIKSKVEEIRQRPGGLKGFIREELTSLFNIKGLDMALELNQAIDFSILQAFSNGMSHGNVYSNKLHSLIIGAPASGKKLLTRCALAQSPNGRLVSSTNAKVTAAGLIGRVRSDGNMSRSDPGIFPLSNNGLVAIEDYHELAKKKNDVASILASVMEDGKILDTTSAMTTHIACASIHLDMNRLSQVELSGEYSGLNDLNLPFNIISRFDYICEIPPDAERQFEVSMSMMGRFSKLTSDTSTIGTEDRMTNLKAIVAYVNSNYKTAELSVETVQYMKLKFSELFLNEVGLLDLKMELGGIMTRLQVSLEKIVKAICTLDLKSSVTTHHIDEAFIYIGQKMKFLSSLDLYKSRTSGDNKAKLSKADRQDLIIKQLSGMDVSLEDTLLMINSQQDFQFDGRTIRRDLDDLVAKKFARKPAIGMWQILDSSKVRMSA